MSITSTSLEVKRLYRECMRACKKFTWTNEKGELWSKILRDSVKKEFEQGKLETDSEIILRMIITGREALRRTEEAMELKRMKLLGFEGETLDDAINNSEVFLEDESHDYTKNTFIKRY